MPFPILTSLVALPAIGALMLLFVRNDEQDRLARGLIPDDSATRQNGF